MTTTGIPRWARICFVALVAIVAMVVVFRLGSRASAAVTLSDPVVWVEDGDRGRILQINGSTREITAAVDVTESNSDDLVALPSGRDAVFLNRTAGEYGEIGAVDLEPVNQVEPDAGSLEEAAFLGELDPETGQHTSFIVSPQNVLIFGSGSTEPLNIPTLNGLGDVVTAPTGQLVAVTADDSQLLISDESGLVRLAELPEPASNTDNPIGLVRSGDGVFVVDSSRRTVQEVDVTSGDFGRATSVCGSLADAQIGGNVLTESDGIQRVLAHDGAGGVLSVSRPTEGDCVEIALSVAGGNFGPPVAVDGFAYLPNYETGQVVVVDMDERVVSRSHAFTPNRGRPFELEVFDGVVWANEPSGPRAAVVSPASIASISKQQAGPIVTLDGDDGDEAVGGESAENAEGQRVVSDEGDPFAPFTPNGGALGADSAVVPQGGDEPPIGTEGEELFEAEPVGADLAEIVESPVVVEEAELAEGEQTALIANFSFSAEVLVVGEEVVLADDSTGNPTEWDWDFGDGTSAQGPEVVKAWGEEGIYTVTMFITNAAGDLAQQTHDFTVVAANIALPPSANFSFESDTIEVGEELTFTDTSTGDPDALLWSFGDDTTDVGPVVTKVFDSVGVFEVTLTASNAQGSDTDSALITVVSGGEPPTAVISNIPTVIDVGQSIVLASESTNSPTSTSWDFGDGESDTGVQVFHSWDEPGEYRITLTVSNATGQDSTFRTIFVEPALDPPIARFTESDLTVIAGELLSFSDLSLNNPDTLVWDFGDGTTAEGANVTKQWGVPDQYTVTLTASNDAGSDSVAKTVTVLPVPVDPPVANFRVPAATVSVGELVAFEDRSTGDPSEWSWNFDDGTLPSSAQNPAHAFSTPGTYEVELTASNDGGSSTFTRTIVVINPPVADFVATVNELTVSLQDLSTNSPTSWRWTFGGATTPGSSGRRVQSPTITFESPGSYPITLVATNEAGDSTPFTTVVTVARRPVASFTDVTQGLQADFTDQSTNDPTNWLWEFGDGNTLAGETLPFRTPSHVYNQDGTYDVTLTVTNAAGSDSITRRVTVQLAPPIASFTCTVIGVGVSCDAGASSGAVSYTWSAPDAVAGTGSGGPGAGITSSFTFPSSPSTAIYPISLTVANASGATNTANVNVNINLPVPEITSVSPNQAGGTVQFTATATNNPTSWAWNVGGGTIQSGGTGAMPTVTFPASGPYTIQVTASNANGTSPVFTHVVNIVLPPSVTAVGQVEAPAGEVALTPTAVNNPTGWSWNVPGSNEVVSSLQNPTFTFGANGSYPSTVTVTNTAGSNTFNFTVNVNNIPAPVAPTVTITSAVDSGGGVIMASATTSAGNISWAISGPGTATPPTASGPNATFTVSTNGTYTLTASAADQGLTGSDTMTVVVSSVPTPPPTANFSTQLGATTAAGTPITAMFTGSAQPGATFAWSIDNGATPASNVGSSATFTAPPSLTPQVYNIMLTVTDPGGLNDSITIPVTVP